MATTEKIIIEIDVVNNTLKDTEDKIKKVSGALVKLKGDEKANEQQLRATEAELRLLNKTYREQDRVLQASIKANQAAEGSLEQLKAQYVVAQAALNKMSAEQRENTDEGKAQIAEVARLNAELKRIESSYGQNARNVGNYSEAVKPLRQQLRELTQQLQILEQQGKGNSAEFQKLSAEAGRIKDTMSDVNNTVKALASDTGLIDGVASGITGIAGAFSAAQGAAALFGEEGEDLQKTLVKIQATMAIANGVQQVANTLQKDSAAMVALTTARTQAAAAAQALYATVVGTSTGALRLFKIALASTGIGAIIILLGELIFNFKGVTDAVADFNEAIGFGRVDYAKWVEEQKRSLGIIDSVSDSIETQRKQADLLFDAYKNLVKEEQERRDLAAGGAKQIERQIKLAQAQGATELDLFNLQVKLNATRIKDIEDQKKGLVVLKAQSKNNLELQKDIALELVRLDNERLDIENDNVIARIDLYKKEADAKAKLLADFEALQKKLLSDNYQFQVDQLTENFNKENKIIEDNYKAGLVSEQDYLTLKLALQQQYSTDFRNILTSDAQFQKDLETELFNNRQTAKAAERTALLEAEKLALEDYKLMSADRIAVSDAEAKHIIENNAALLKIVTEQSDLISKAFVESIDENGLNLEQFSKRALAITIDTIEKIVTAQTLAAVGLVNVGSLATGQSIATGGVAGIIQAAALTALIKAAFTVFKTQLLATFEEGGIIPKAANGMLVGARHAQGGIKINTPTGMIEAEGGEVIINRKSVQMYKPLLSAINEAGGGVKFADGGQIYSPPVNQEISILADMFKTMPQPVVSVVDIIDVTQKVGRVKATATL